MVKLIRLVFLLLTIVLNSASLLKAQVTSYPYSESFESGFGSWSQEAGDEFDWTRTNQATPSGQTGPNSAFAGSFYIYTEASNPRQEDDDAYLSNQFDLTGSLTSATMTLRYHMDGADMGRFRVRVSTGGGYTNLFTENQDLGDVWNFVSIDLSAYIGNVVTIRLDGRRCE